MARYKATIQGQRGMASRLGGTKSGISAQVNGWNVGVSVCGGSVNDPKEDSDVFDVCMSGGSNARYGQTELGSVLVDSSGKPSFIVAQWVLDEAKKQGRV